ncbi:MAG TPA: DUF417 family protein [Gemmatimonadaceae bacterium]|nr:DUF417 family protein [Gemmatimonadaceae bacterium]
MTSLQKWTLPAGQAVARYSVAMFFVAFGLTKFTTAEAATIHPLLVHSPFLFWLPALFGQQLSSGIIGVIEIVLGLLMASRRFSPRFSAIGSLGITGSLMMTLSFLFTTPHLDPGLASFIVKDVTLLGVALWSAGEALLAASTRRNRVAPRATERTHPVMASAQ